MTRIQSVRFMMRAFAGAAAGVAMGWASSAYAADGTWTNLATGGLWSNTANWQDGIIADGSGFTANFNTLNITADNTNRLDSARTLGNLIFGDTTTNSVANWILGNNGNGANILTLAGTMPTITVNALGTGKSATIAVNIQGTDGLFKDGSGQLTLGTAASGNQLTGTNTFTGGLTIKAGTVAITGPLSAGNGSITIGDTAAGSTAAATLILAGIGGSYAYTHANAIVLGASSGLLTINATTSALLSFTGGVTGANNLRIEENNSGAGTMTFSTGSMNNTGTINNKGTGAAGTSVTISSQIGSNVMGIIQDGTTKLAISGASPAFIGDTTLTSGTLNLRSANALQNSVVNMNAGSLTFGTSATVGLSATSLGGLAGSVDVNLNDTLTSPAAVALTLGNSNAPYAGNTLNPAYSGVLKNTTTAGGSLAKVGSNAQTLTGASTYTGATAVNGGTLDLGGGTANGSLASTALNLGGGTFSYTRTGGTTQAFTTVTATAGLSAIRAAAGSTLTLGALASSGGTVDIGNTGTITTSTGNNNGIIGNWVTFNNGTTWAVANGVDNAITGLSDATYTNTTSAGTIAAHYLNANIDVDNSAGLLDGVITPNSLRFNTAAATTVTLATGINTLTSGGILVTPTVGANLSTITGGTLTGAASASLNVVQNNTDGGLTINSIIADNGGATGLAKAGAGLLTLTGINTYTGSTTISGGTLTIGGAGSLGAAGSYAGTIINNGALVYSSSAAQSISVISGAGSVTKDTSTSSTLTLSGANTFSGGLFVKAGKVQLSSGNGTAASGGSGSITLGDGGAANVTLGMGGSTGGTTYNNPIILNGNSASQLNVNFANISMASAGSVSGTGNLIINDTRSGGSLSFGTGGINHIGAITNNGGSATVTVNGVIGNNVTGVTQASGTLILSVANTAFIGDTTVTAGTLSLRNSNSLQKSVLIMNGGSVTYTLTDYALGGLSGAGNFTSPTGKLVLGNSNAPYGGNTLNPTYSGVLSGSASLTKVGTNTQTFVGANTYSGGTTVSNGTLWVSNTSGSGTGSGAVTVATNATLGGIGMITGTVTVASGGILSPGTNSVGTLTVGSLKLDANAKFEVAISGAASYDRCVVSTGAVDIASSILSLTVAPGYVPKFNSTFTIIQNVKGDAVTGTFANGATVMAPGLTSPFEISTTGAGNDVVLRYTGGGGTLILVF